MSAQSLGIRRTKYYFNSVYSVYIFTNILYTSIGTPTTFESTGTLTYNFFFVLQLTVVIKCVFNIY